MTSPIERLPVEVFDIILSTLGLDQYQQLRLCSRQLRSLSLSPFTKKYFSSTATTLGAPSLKRLAELSDHPYGHAVTQLNVKLLTYRDYKTLMAIRRCGIYPPPKRFPLVRGVRLTDVRDESTLFDDLKDPKRAKLTTERLARSLANLKNLRVVCFRSMHSEPHGWTLREMPSSDQIFRQRCFQVLIDAVIQSEIKLEEFNMAKSMRSKHGRVLRSADLECPAFGVVSVALTLSQAFDCLQSLTLSLTSNRVNSLEMTGGEACPSQFIARIPSLKHLTLKLDRDSYRSYDSSNVFHHIAKSCRLPALESFNLLNCALRSADLSQYLSAHADSLRTISFTCVYIFRGTWTAIWEALKEAENLQTLTAARLDSPQRPPSVGKKYHPKMILDIRSSAQPMEDMLEDLIVTGFGEKPHPRDPMGRIIFWE